jgi:hypothetical protein
MSGVRPRFYRHGRVCAASLRHGHIASQRSPLSSLHVTVSRKHVVPCTHRRSFTCHTVTSPSTKTCWTPIGPLTLSRVFSSLATSLTSTTPCIAHLHPNNASSVLPSELARVCPRLSRVSGLVDTLPLPIYTPELTAFNDLVLHSFTRGNITSLFNE